MGEAMKKVDHLVARAFKGAMAFVLAVGLCPVAPAMAQEGATANEEGGAAAVADGAGASTDGAGAGAAGGVAGSEADGMQPGGVSGDGDAAADGAGVGAPAQDAVENDVTDSGISAGVVEAAAAADGGADESNDADAQTDGWQAWGGCEWMVDSEGCLTIRPANGAEVGQLPNVAGCAPWCVGTYAHSIESVKVEKCVKTSDSADDLFKDLSAAVTMDLSGLDVSSATNMSYMFRACGSLASLDLSGWDTSSATNMREMFSGCGSLASLDLSGWDVSSVTNMSDMFLFCGSLASLDLSGWDVSSVMNMSGMFDNCGSLTSLDLSGWDTSSATNMSAMFFECTSLASLDLSGWDVSFATHTFYMFSGCSSMREVSLGPATLVDLPAPSGDGVSGRWVSSVDGVAYRPSDVPSGVAATYTAQLAESEALDLNSLGGCVWTLEEGGALAISPLPGCASGDLCDMHRGDYPFSRHSSEITSVRVAPGVKASESLSGLFSGLSAAVTMDLSGLDVSSATNMSYMFRDCGSLASLDLSGWDASSATNMRGMFSGCGSLASLDLSGWDASKVTDMSSMFSGCSSLASLDLSGWDTFSVTNMSSMFSGCSSLASLDLSSFDDSSLKSDTYRSDMFNGCVILERILVGEHFALRDLMPVPSSIEGWTGKWVNEAGSAFTSGEVPVGKKDIYRAQIGLNADMFTVDCSDSVYTGYEITKAVLSSKLLEGFDYNVSYSSNVYVGIASINITGIGRATGALHYEFNITKAKPEYESPAPVEAAYGQTLSDVALPKGFSWQDDPSTSVGELGEREFLATFTPGDTSNYEAVRDVPVKVRVIRPVDASMFSVDAAGLVYDGSAHEPAVSSAVVPEGSYSVEYRDNVSAGEATAVVSGSGFYSGSCELKFAIAKAKPEYEIPSGICGAYGEPLSSVQLPAGYSWQDAPDRPIDWYGDKTLYATYSPADLVNYEVVNAIPVSVFVQRNTVDVPSVESLVYSGEKQTPAITLDSNVEVVTNEGGVDAGSYCVEFALKTPEFDRWSDGSFANKIVTYSIDPLDIAEAEVSVGEAYLENGKSEPSVSVSIAGSSLVQSRDYVLAYENNDALGEGIAKIQGKGNYSGTREVPFTILKNPVIAKGSCGQGVTYKIYDSGLMTIDGSGDVSFSGTNPPYSAAAKDVKVVIVDEGITSFCGFTFSGLKKCQAIFFKGNFVSGYGKYFKEEQYAFSGLNDNCRLYRSPGDATWSDRVAGKNCKPWVDGMLDIDWASMTEFGACGDESFWVLSNDGTLSVRGSGAVTDSAYGVQQRSLVSRLVVEDGITSIGDKFTISSYSYTGFENISSVTFADSVEELPAGMLRGCSSLQKIDLPSGIKAIPDKFLYGCTSLGSVQIPDAVTKIGEESFYGCSSLQSVGFGSSVNTIGAESFAKCASLAAISLPKTVVSIGEKAFSETGVVELVFPASVEEMDRSTFDKCPSLTKVVFEGAFPSLEGGSYSGNQIIGIHRANDETWQVRGKYNIGDITWYTENADGSLVEDDYISPWSSKNLEIDGGYSGDMHSGSRNHYAYYFTVNEADSFDINWSVSPWYDGCTH